MMNVTTREKEADDSWEPPGESASRQFKEKVQRYCNGEWWERTDLYYKAGDLCFGRASLSDLILVSQELPMFLYRPVRVVEKTKLIRDVLPQVILFYAVKANRHPAVLKQMLETVDGIDVCSPHEAKLALESGFSENQISYTGTSLSNSDMTFLIEHPQIHVNVDSLSCLRRLASQSQGRTIGVRINPEMGIGYRNEARLVYSVKDRPSKFGLLVEQIPEAVAIAKEHKCCIDTVHWHVGCGWLDEQLDELAAIIRQATTIAFQLPDLRRVNLGGGLGVPFQSDDTRLSLDRWAAIVQETIAGRWQIMLEPGSFLVQDAGILLTQVNTVERKRDWTIVGVNAGFNLVMEPVFYGMPLEPLFVKKPEATRPVELITIAGNINEAHDLLVRDFKMPVPYEGEWLAFLNAGAYGAAMSSNHCLRGNFQEIIVV